MSQYKHGGCFVFCSRLLLLFFSWLSFILYVIEIITHYHNIFVLITDMYYCFDYRQFVFFSEVLHFAIRNLHTLRAIPHAIALLHSIYSVKLHTILSNNNLIMTTISYTSLYWYILLIFQLLFSATSCDRWRSFMEIDRNI